MKILGFLINSLNSIRLNQICIFWFTLSIASPTLIFAGSVSPDFNSILSASVSDIQYAFSLPPVLTTNLVSFTSLSNFVW